jgi:hypothetical protein
MRVPLLEAELLKAEQDPGKIAVYHERLERVFEKKWRLLMDYRERQGTGEEQMQGQPAASQTPAPAALPAGA